MCGIAGFVGTGNCDDLHAMMGAMVHRGPDSSGIFYCERNQVFLGHRRLSIIDPDGGAQPMWDKQRKFGVVFNGEIYNHLELRAALERYGHKFLTSHSDTEVLVHGWKQWGTELLTRLNGMFGFAIYDCQAQRIFLARDRFGEKPLYYSVRKNVFAFASELTALIQHGEIPAELDHVALQKLFAYGYIPSPRALWLGCHKLPAGHWLEYDLASGATKLRQYWRFQLEPDERMAHVDESQLVDEFRSLLDKSVARRLMSDVPLGIFLSGGLDSSSIVASATRVAEKDTIQTFCVGFEEPSFDESSFARAVAEHFGVIHSERVLSMKNAADLIPKVLSCLDEPFGDASIIPTYLLSAFTRERVTVALSGDGGDELLAGYDPFAALGLANMYASVVPSFIHTLLLGMANRMPISEKNMSLDFKLKRTLTGLSYPKPLWNPVWMAPVEPNDMADLFGSPVNAEELYEEVIELWDDTEPAKDTMDRALEFFTRFYLQEDILFKADRAAMMNSLESRAVFLDNDLSDFCRRLPNKYKLRGKTRKYLLKKAMKGILPENIVSRRKKGFGIPLASWLRQLPEPLFWGDVAGLNQQEVSKRWHQHRNGQADHRLFLWTWLNARFVCGHQEARPNKD